MEKILVTGATGKLGHEVIINLLNKTNPGNIFALARNPEKAADLKALNINIRKGDYYDYDSLLEAFRDIDKLFFVSTNDMVNRESQQENVVKAAVNAKVKHIIYTSFQRKNETKDSPINFLTNAHIQTEKAIKLSGLKYTILKNGLYTDFLSILLGNVLESGKIFLPAGNGKAAYTLRSDLAEASVKILTENGHDNKTYDLVADKQYSFSDLAQILSKVSGKEISYISPEVSEFKTAMLNSGVPEGYVNMFAGCAEGIKQGEFDYADKTLRNVLGRECSDIENFFSTIFKN